MGATYNNKKRIVKGDVVQVTKLSVPNIRLTQPMIEKINKAFQLSSEYIRGGEVSLTVKNPSAQYTHNSNVTGRVVLKVKGRKELVTIDLFGYWPSWKNIKDDKGNVIRFYSKEHGAAVLNLMRSGNFSNPTTQSLEHIAYCALSVIKSRKNTPREGLIKARVLDYLEDTGIEVVKAWYRGSEYSKEFITSKIATMQTIFDAMQSIGEFKAIERKSHFVAGITGQ